MDVNQGKLQTSLPATNLCRGEDCSVHGKCGTSPEYCSLDLVGLFFEPNGIFVLPPFDVLIADSAHTAHTLRCSIRLEVLSRNLASSVRPHSYELLVRNVSENS
jgi:hypothetical protein